MIKSVLFSVCFVKVKGSSASRQAGLFTDYSSLSWKSSLTSRSNSITDSFRLSWSSFWKLSNVSSSLYATMNWSSLYSSISSETGGTPKFSPIYCTVPNVGLAFPFSTLYTYVLLIPVSSANSSKNSPNLNNNTTKQLSG